MGEPHIETVLGLLEAAFGGRAQVYDGDVPKDPHLPYVVVYSDLGAASRSRLAPRSDRLDFTPQTTAVGSTPEMARWAAGICRRALIDTRVTVPGRQPARIAHAPSGSQPVRRDDDISPPVFYAIDQFTLTTYPGETP